MSFSNGQLVQASDLNNLSVTTVTTSGAIAAGTTLTTGGAINGQTISATASFTGTVAAAGLVDLSAAGAGQIKFPASQNASSNANTLDDYEEGTWTPVIGGSGGTSGQTYASQVGTYEKIGKVVIAHFDVTLTAKGTITTNVQIQGLPFTAGSGQSVYGSALQWWQNTASSLVSTGLLVAQSSTAANVYGITAAATGQANLATADIANNTRLIGVCIYEAAS